MLNRLDVSKRSGTDGLSTQWLRLAATGISSSLAYLFNQCLGGEGGGLLYCELGKWLILLTLVHKGGSNFYVGNFPPISMLPVVVIGFGENYLPPILSRIDHNTVSDHTIQSRMFLFIYDR